MKILMVMIAALGLASAVGAQDKPMFDAAKAVKGERSYRTYCASCHGADAKGTGPLAEHMKVPPANLRELSSKNNGEFPYEEVVKTINMGRHVRGHGSLDMPAWGKDFLQTDTKQEAQERIEDLTQYIWSLNR